MTARQETEDKLTRNIMSELNDPRVLFAAERTLLAWNRTSIALIGFGFIVERSSLLIAAITAQPVSTPGSGILTLLVGLGFMLLGIFAVLFSSLQYARILKTVRPADFPAGYSPKFGLLVNFLVGFLGAVLSVALYLRHVDFA